MAFCVSHPLRMNGDESVPSAVVSRVTHQARKLRVEVPCRGRDSRFSDRLCPNCCSIICWLWIGDRSLNSPVSQLLHLQEGHSVDSEGSFGGSSGIMYIRVPSANFKQFNRCYCQSLSDQRHQFPLDE